MNIQIISKFLQVLRKSHNYTQDSLAKLLDISRQAVSNWETGKTIPDLELLLTLSKLYGLTINEILEPSIQPKIISDFEQISQISEIQLKKALEQFDEKSVSIALMGASPETNNLLSELFPDTNFTSIQHSIGRVRIEEVENMQNQIAAMINLLAIDT